MTYLLDTNVFIEAKDRYYRFLTFPGFWEWLEKLGDFSLLSINMVREELINGNDELKTWIQKRPKRYFIDESSEINQNNFRKIIEWIKVQDYKDSAVNDFLRGADPWLIAHAMSSKDYTIVTQETSQPKSKKKIRIPDVCNIFKIPYCNTFEFLEYYKTIFNLSSSEIV